MLRLTHVTQLDQGVANMCFQAVFGLKWQWLTGEYVTALMVARRTNTDDGTFTEPRYEIPRIYRTYGVQWHHEGAATWDWWVDRIASGRPAAALVHYGKLTGSKRDADQFAHFVLPVGIEGDTVWIHDPLKRTGPTAYSVAAFRAAIETVSPGNLYATQAYVMDSERRMTKRGMGWWLSLGNTTAGALEEFVQMCEETRPAALTLVNDHGDDKFAYQALDIQKRLPQTRIVYRRTIKHHDGKTADNTQDVITPERWIQLHLMFRNTPVYCMVNNEPRMDPANLPDIDRTVQWHLRVAQLARFNGIKSSHVGFSAGAPHESLYARWDPLLRYMAANPGWFQIDVHEYFRALWCHELAAGAKQPSQWPTVPNARPLWLLGRYRRWIDRCREIGIECPPIFISEWGPDATGAIPPEVYGNTKGLPSCLPVWQSWDVGDPEVYGAEQLKAAWRVLYQHEPKVVGVCFFMYTDHAEYWSEFNARPFDRFVQATKEGFDTMGSNPIPQPVTGIAAGAYRLNYPGGRVNVRATGSTSAAVVTTVGHGEAVDILTTDGVYDGKWTWQNVLVGGKAGIMATKGGDWKFDPRNVDVELWQDVKGVRDMLIDATDTLTAALRAAGVE